MDYLLLIYPIALLIIYAYKSEVFKSDSFVSDCLSKEQAKMTQAIACMFVVLHHLTQIITGYGDLPRGPITILSSMGILFTSVFFFYSGYGLIISVKNNEKYLDDFLRHRLSTVLVPFFVANIIAVLIRIYYMKIPMNTTQIVQCILGYVLINGNGWYIVEIVFIYIAFYSIFKIIKNERIATVLLCCFVVFLICTGYVSGHDFSTLGNHWFKGEWWYNSTIVFIQGVIFAWYKEQIIGFLKRHYSMMLGLFVTAFIVLFYVEEIIRKRFGYYNELLEVNHINGKWLTFVSQMVLCVVFMVVVILIQMKVKTGNKALKWLSSISMEMFLLHGLFINYLFDIKRKNELIVFAIVIVCGLVSAAIVSVFDRWIINFINDEKSIFEKIISIVRHKGNKSYVNECGIDLIRERKNKRKKQILISVYIILGIALVCILVRNVFLLPADAKREVKELSNADVNDIVHFGRYEINPEIPFRESVEWIVVKKEDDKLMLVTKEGIESSAYHKKHEEVSFEESDIYRYLNEELFDKLFSDYEKEYIVPAMNGSEYLSLMSEEEATGFFTKDEDRQLLATEHAKKKGANVNTPSKINSWDYKDYRASWWWLRGGESVTAPIVTPEGTIEADTKYVNKPNGAVRPVVWVRVK